MPTPSKHSNQLFRRRWFDEESVTTCVRWYLSCPLSYRDLVRMKGERGVRVSHTTIMRWTIRYAFEFGHRWRRVSRRPRAS
jgi:IS6 family transposase